MENKKYELEVISTQCPPLPICPAIYQDKKSGDYIIQGSLVHSEEVVGLVGKMGKNEQLVKIPKSLVDNLK